MLPYVSASEAETAWRVRGCADGGGGGCQQGCGRMAHRGGREKIHNQNSSSIRRSCVVALCLSVCLLVCACLLACLLFRCLVAVSGETTSHGGRHLDPVINVHDLAGFFPCTLLSRPSSFLTMLLLGSFAASARAAQPSQHLRRCELRLCRACDTLLFFSSCLWLQCSPLSSCALFRAVGVNRSVLYSTRTIIMVAVAEVQRRGATTTDGLCFVSPFSLSFVSFSLYSSAAVCVRVSRTMTLLHTLRADSCFLPITLSCSPASEFAKW